MPIKTLIRKLDAGFTVLPNEVIQDLCGTPDALTMFCVMVSVPDNWEFHEKWIMSQLDIGRRKYLNARRVLSDKGYWVNAAVRNKDGKLQGSVIWIDPNAPSQRSTESHVLRQSVKPTVGECDPLVNKQKDSKETRSIGALPDFLNQQAWGEFLQHRKEIRKPLSDLAKTKAINSLKGLTAEQQQQCIDLTIQNRWTGIFPDRFKEKNHAASKGHYSASNKSTCGTALDNIQRFGEQFRDQITKAG